MKLFYSPTNPRIGLTISIALLEDWEEAQYLNKLGQVLSQFQMRPDGLYDWYSKYNQYLPNSTCKLDWRKAAKLNPDYYINVVIIA
jgi:hypothetical protein